MDVQPNTPAMRKITLLLSVLLFFCIRAEASPVQVSSQIQSVKVYRTAALIERTAEINLPAGSSELHFTALSPFLDIQSVMVGTGPDVLITSVRATREFLTELPRSPEFIALQEEIDQLTRQLQLDRAGIEVMNEEENLLLQNRAIGGQHTGVTADRLREMAEYFRQRLTDIKQARIVLQHDMEERNKRLARLRQQQGELQKRYRPENSYTVVVKVNNTRAGKTGFKLRYLAGNASWASTFDFRVSDINKPLRIDYKGEVVNNTGEDWVNVNLTLSTGDPARSNVIPVLTPWRLRYFNVRTTMDMAAPALSEIAMRNIRGKAQEDVEVDYAQTGLAQSSENLTTTEFTLRDAISVMSNGQVHTLVLETREEGVEYRYTIVPRFSTLAYLSARINQYEQLNLTSGPAGIYHGNDFIGRTHINTHTAEDYLEVSLGADIGIFVKREKLSESSTRRFLANRREETHTWSITVRNNKTTLASIQVMDQMPLAADDDIEVRHTVMNNGELDTDTGIIRWDIELNAGESRELRFSYTVRYARNRSIAW